MNYEEVSTGENPGSNERMSEASIILGTSMAIIQAFGTGVGADGFTKELNITFRNTFTSLKDQYLSLRARYQAGFRPFVFASL